MSAKKKEDGLVSTAAAAEALGITASQFRSLVAKRGTPPDKTYVNPHYRSGPRASLWSKTTLARLGRTKAVAELRAKNQQQAAEAAEWRARWDAEAPARARAEQARLRARERRLVKRYGKPESAIADAAAALFAWNRYRRRDAHIRQLKAAFVTAVYQLQRYTDRVVALERYQEPMECELCEGRPPTKDCSRCDGTGYFREGGTRVAHAFHFTIAGEHYSWVQPQNSIDFVPECESREKDDGPARALEVGELPTLSFEETKELVDFACRAAPAEQEDLRALAEDGGE